MSEQHQSLVSVPHSAHQFQDSQSRLISDLTRLTFMAQWCFPDLIIIVVIIIRERFHVLHFAFFLIFLPKVCFSI